MRKELGSLWFIDRSEDLEPFGYIRVASLKFQNTFVLQACRRFDSLVVRIAPALKKAIGAYSTLKSEIT